MNTTAIIQARMGSTRLPGKVMKTLGDKTVLGHVIERCLAIPSVDQVIVATTVLDEDAVICREAEKYEVEFYRGSVSNVLSRYYEAARQAGADHVVRLTSDCPLLDPDISDAMIRHFIKHGFDYSRVGLDSFPRGLDTEVFTFQALEQTVEQATSEFDLEHVTTYIQYHGEYFRNYVFRNTVDHSSYRLTLDTPEDWSLISAIYNELYEGEIFGWPAVLKLLQARPELAKLNEEIRQKKYGEK